MTMPWTLALLGAGLALAGLGRWHEARPRELGEVRLLPPTLLLGVGVLLTILALAHLVTLTTGVPLEGRRAF
jgi:hypothetical protein